MNREPSTLPELVEWLREQADHPNPGTYNSGLLRAADMVEKVNGVMMADLEAVAKEPPGSRHFFTGDPAGGDHRIGRYTEGFPCWCVARTDAIERLLAAARPTEEEAAD